jgi:hypothetical protein
MSLANDRGRLVHPLCLWRHHQRGREAAARSQHRASQGEVTLRYRDGDTTRVPVGGVGEVAQVRISRQET